MDGVSAPISTAGPYWSCFVRVIAEQGSSVGAVAVGEEEMIRPAIGISACFTSALVGHAPNHRNGWVWWRSYVRGGLEGNRRKVRRLQGESKRPGQKVVGFVTLINVILRIALKQKIIITAVSQRQPHVVGLAIRVAGQQRAGDIVPGHRAGRGVYHRVRREIDSVLPVIQRSAGALISAAPDQPD